jgi:hypothetical protein
LEAFVLGDCDEDLAVEIEERLFSEDAFYEHVERTKSSLIAREARGELSAKLSRLLREQALRSPALQEDIDRARKLHRQSIESRGLEQAAAPGTLLSSLIQLIRTSRTIQVASASLLLAATFFLTRPLRMHPSFHQASSVDASQAQANSKVAAHGPKTSETFFLAATVLRGEVNIPILSVKDVSLPITLQIEVRNGLPCCWSVVILHDTDKVLTQPNLKSRSAGPISYLEISFPPATLKSGHYQAQLTLVDPSQSSQAPLTLARTFQVVSPN